MIDFNFENNNIPLPGRILISEPFLADRFFTRSVIYLCEHSESGSFGFVLNNYVENTMSEMIDDFPNVGVRVSLGGPVDTSNLFFIHSMGDQIESAQKLVDDMYIGGKFDKVKALIEKDPENAKRFRFFVGYSGWGANQLEDELKEKSWIVLKDISTETVLNTANEDLWKDLMTKMGGKFKVMSEFPTNPSDN